MIYIKSKGDLGKTEKFLKNNNLKKKYLHILEKYGEQGVEALSNATPKKTGLTAASWKYRITETGKNVRIVWYNTNIQNGFNVAINLQYGHGTRNGGYVEGTDYINPAMKPIFQELADAAWEEVKKG